MHVFKLLYDIINIPSSSGTEEETDRIATHRFPPAKPASHIWQLQGIINEAVGHYVIDTALHGK